ncbi:hypothetical protein TWF173_004596 [Orbilia oligospora]|nr:hypothetical protein TWF173_004596 [Orbilia oligospora]
MSDSTRALRLISLDGGDVWGLSSLAVLGSFMERLNRKLKAKTNFNHGNTLT